MSLSSTDSPDVVLIGAGIMSATLGTLLKELDPSLSVTLFESLHDCAQESSQGWNNAGTGHAANCELNYTPQRHDGSVDIAKALKVNTQFDLSRQLWAHLVRKGAIPDPQAFIHACPHLSFVWGADNVAFLRERYRTMSAHHCYQGMEYSEDRAQIAEWAPLIMEGRSADEPVAATRMVTGTDVDYGALTHLLVRQLSQQSGFAVHYHQRVVDLARTDGGRWRVTVEDVEHGGRTEVTARFVFIGAGGGSLPLLQKSGIPEGHGFGGFPISGIWLRCDVPALAERHQAKVYGKAPSGSPPMSVPHLDTRIVGGQRSLLFGPYAGFSTRFLKHGALTDLFTSLRHDNILPLLNVAKDNMDLTEYLIGQIFQSANQQFAMLQQFFPLALKRDWQEAVAGQRVQTIKPTGQHGLLSKKGELEFGTELVSAADRSIAALLGASPGASTAAAIALEVLETCFPERLTEDAWLPALRLILPTYGLDLKTDAAACRQSRAETAKVLGIVDV